MQQRGTKKIMYLERLLVALRQQMLMETGHVRRKVIISIASTSCRRDSRILGRCCRTPRRQAGKSMGVPHCFLPGFVSLSLRKRMISRKLFWKTNQPNKSLPPTPAGPPRVSWNRGVTSLPQTTVPLADQGREGGAQGCDGHNSGALMRDLPPWSVTGPLGLFPHLPV